MTTTRLSVKHTSPAPSAPARPIFTAPLPAPVVLALPLAFPLLVLALVPVLVLLLGGV